MSSDFFDPLDILVPFWRNSFWLNSTLVSSETESNNGDDPCEESNLRVHRVIIASENGTLYRMTQRGIEEEGEEIEDENAQEIFYSKNKNSDSTADNKIVKSVPLRPMAGVLKEGARNKDHYVLDCSSFTDPGHLSFGFRQKAPERPAPPKLPEHDFYIRTADGEALEVDKDGKYIKTERGYKTKHYDGKWIKLSRDKLSLWDLDPASSLIERKYVESSGARMDENGDFLYTREFQLRETVRVPKTSKVEWREGESEILFRERVEDARLEGLRQVERVIDQKMREYVQESLHSGLAVSLMPLVEIPDLYRLMGSKDLVRRICADLSGTTCFVINCKAFKCK